MPTEIMAQATRISARMNPAGPDLLCNRLKRCMSVELPRRPGEQDRCQAGHAVSADRSVTNKWIYEALPGPRPPKFLRRPGLSTTFDRRSTRTVSRETGLASGVGAALGGAEERGPELRPVQP